MLQHLEPLPWQSKTASFLRAGIDEAKRAGCANREQGKRSPAARCQHRRCLQVALASRQAECLKWDVLLGRGIPKRRSCQQARLSAMSAGGTWRQARRGSGQRRRALRGECPKTYWGKVLSFKDSHWGAGRVPASSGAHGTSSSTLLTKALSGSRVHPSQFKRCGGRYPRCKRDEDFTK